MFLSVCAVEHFVMLVLLNALQMYYYFYIWFHSLLVLRHVSVSLMCFFKELCEVFTLV